MLLVLMLVAMLFCPVKVALMLEIGQQVNQRFAVIPEAILLVQWSSLAHCTLEVSELLHTFDHCQDRE